jgi:hypothetical protein
MSNQVRRRSWWIYILFFLVTQLSAGFIIVALNRFDPGLLMSNQNSLAPAMLFGNLLGILLFFCFRPQSITWSSTLAGCKGQKGRRSILIFLLALPTILLVNLTQEILFPDLPDLVGEEQFKQLMFHPLGLLTISLVGPLCEELLFRGGVQTDLSLYHSNQGWFVPIAFSSIIFALVHVNPAQMPAALTLGLLLGFAYWWTGSLVASVAIHVFNNSFACLLAFISPDDTSLVHLLGGRTSAGIVVVVSLFWLYLAFRAVRKEGLRQA